MTTTLPASALPAARQRTVYALMPACSALVMPATLSLMFQVTAPEKKGEAVAIWTAATGAAGVLGNIGGGLILQYLPWQGLFLTIAPLALLLAALAARTAPRGERHPAELDLLGSVLLTATVGAFLYGVIEAPVRGWGSVQVVGALALSAILMVLFGLHALRTAHPLVDPRLFRAPRLRAGALGVSAAFFGLFALFYVNAQYLQYVKGYGPLRAGAAIAPLAIGVMVMSRRSVALARRFGDATTLVGTAGIALGLFLCVPILSAAVMAALPPAKAGLGSGLNGATREIGSALGVAAMGTALNSRPAAAFLPAMAFGFRTVAVLVLAASALTFLWWRQARR